MLKLIKESWRLLCLAAAAFLIVGMFAPPILRAVDRQRFAGLWHVEGTMENWRFGFDGTYRNESLVALEGSYTLLPSNRIDITTGFNGTRRYVYRFDGVGLVLTLEGQKSGYRLLPTR